MSGYNLDQLLPENNFHVARLLVGSESTLVTVLRAELSLVRVPAANSLVLLGFDDICAAADAVPRILEHSPAASKGSITGWSSSSTASTSPPRPYGNYPTAARG